MKTYRIVDVQEQSWLSVFYTTS
uniref:Uncharacterized protein n=1 Tax=Anguilla anguilla TaxID=7936 RepID=A0A0E9PR92_ANGAN